MMYSIRGDELVLSQVGDAYNQIANTGLFKWRKADKTMRATLSIDSITALEDIFHRLPEPLRRSGRSSSAGNRCSRNSASSWTGDPKPLVHYPVKANLMRHQIVGANMALIAFGLFDEEQEVHTNA